MARKLLEPNPDNSSIHELKEASRVGSSETSMRCTAIQMLIVGIPREQVYQALLVSDRSVRAWINLFNEKGVDGLIVNKRPGRTSIITGDTAVTLTKLIDNPEQAERTFWTAKAFHGFIADSFKIECSYQTVVRFFHREGFSLKVPQPWPDRQDEAKRKEFRERLKLLCEQTDTDIWFADESGFEGDPRPRKRWDRVGAKTRITKNGDHLRMNVIGMVCPRTGEFFAIEASHSDFDTFQIFINEADKSINFQRPKNILILDNASWHRKKALEWKSWEPLFLPPYSPDYNPIERLWLVMKAKWFNNYVCKNVGHLIERLDQAILDIIGNPDKTKITSSIGKLI